MRMTGGMTGFGSANLEAVDMQPALELIDIRRCEGLAQAEQIREMSSYLENMDALKYDNWEKLTLDERLEALQSIENKAASLSGRDPLQVVAVDLGGPDRQGVMTQGQMNWASRQIEMNVHLLKQDSLTSLRECTDTILHEGRHAYQWSNLYVRRTEPNDELYNSWRMNILETGYLSCDRFGFQRYSMQPVELDARVFAADTRANLYYR